MDVIEPIYRKVRQNINLDWFAANKKWIFNFFFGLYNVTFLVNVLVNFDRRLFILAILPYSCFYILYRYSDDAKKKDSDKKAVETASNDKQGVEGEDWEVVDSSKDDDGGKDSQTVDASVELATSGTPSIPTALTEGASRFGYNIPVPTIEATSVELYKNRDYSLQISTNRITYSEKSGNRIHLIFDDNELINVKYDSTSYKKYGELPSKVADVLAAARVAINRRLSK